MSRTEAERFVSITDPKQAYEELRAETDRAVLDLLAAGHYLLGEAVSAFENDAAAYLGTTHAIGVSSGTDALLLSLQALGVGPGDEVITTAYSFIASATCVARLGAKPVFVDIDPATLQMDPEGVAAAVTAKTRVLIPVHLYGYPAPMDRYIEIAEAPEDPIAIVEDAAQAIGTVCRVGPERSARKAGSIGIWGCYSFYPTKNLPACGDAGLMVTSQPNQAQRATELRVHGMDAQYHHVSLAGVSRIDAIQAAILQIRLRAIERWNDRRRSNAALYDHLLTDAQVAGEMVELPAPVPEGELSNYHQYTVRARDRDALRRHLLEKGIAAGIYYPLALPFQPIFRELGARAGSFPHAEQACEDVLSLPIHQYVSSADVERVVTEIAAFYFVDKGRR